MQRSTAIRGLLAEKSYPEIRAFLEGVKQALPEEEKIVLEIMRPPRRNRFSVSSSQEESARFSTDSQNYSLTDSQSKSANEAIEAIFTETYKSQELSFSEAQKQVVLKIAHQIVDGTRSGARSKAHTAERYLFSNSDQKKIWQEYGEKTMKLFSAPLSGWDGNHSGRGKWRLLYKRREHGVQFFGVYDTHKNPFIAYA